PPTVSVTETSIAAQHFDPRDNELPQDSGWGEWMNRLDAAIRQGRWSAGLRLDSAVYWRRPADHTDPAPSVETPAAIASDGESRFRDSIYPAKLWATYSAPGVEVTAGDAYVQFGRGLTLSMRKIDELGIDTTVRGGKVQIERDPFAVTLVAGFANPARIDEASGRALFATAGDPSNPVFGSDRLVGADIMAGRGLPVTLSTHAVHFSRCAPYHYGAGGAIESDVTQAPGSAIFGTCDSVDEATWLSALGAAIPTQADRGITMIGQSLEVPDIAGHLKLYLEAAAQSRTPFDGTPIEAIAPDAGRNDTGNAIYGTLSVDAGPVTTTLEVKSNRNFYPVAAAVDTTRAPEFNVLAYSFVPPAETPTILDTEFGFFNACVNGGRLRADVQAGDSLLLYGQGIFASTTSENTAGGCDARGRVVSSLPAAQVSNTVWDGLAGMEWTFDEERSHVFASLGVREDSTGAGGFFYRERHLEYSVAKVLGGPYSIEIQGFHRLRWEINQNAYPGQLGTFHWWHEGENYVAFKIAPAWVLTQGFEYTTFYGDPTYYFNGSVLYRFSSGDNLRVFLGQQRGAFRCASGICRFFPPFEGARVELTLRF
ncbi:MAG TPA: hypothetical protein VHV30_01380, partial [Polyangiaceae bacterium]|nr:hypothetical protein [Polyangiaceae bacterium]